LEFASSIVRKKDGSPRFCIDFRKVNEVTQKDAYPLPYINAILDKLRRARYISSIDLKQGYWQIPLSAESKPVTAFTVPGRGLFQFKVMPFGLHSAPATFQRLLDRIISPELEPHAFAYLDDIIVLGETFEDHLENLKEVFRRLRMANLKLNPDKCQFCRKSLKYLGHMVTAEGIRTDPEKVEAIQKFPTPKNVREVRRFLGTASWYRRFVPSFSEVVAPLTRLLKKNYRWKWTAEQEKAFHSFKEMSYRSPDFDLSRF
jgi:Reverse transcriptase (RNA-dependent DNA polymerase).